LTFLICHWSSSVIRAPVSLIVEGVLVLDDASGDDK